MKLVKFTRPDDGLVWINPEHVVRVSSEHPYPSGRVEILLSSGVQTVLGDLDEIVSKLAG